MITCRLRGNLARGEPIMIENFVLDMIKTENGADYSTSNRTYRYCQQNIKLLFK